MSVAEDQPKPAGVSISDRYINSNCSTTEISFGILSQTMNPRPGVVIIGLWLGFAMFAKGEDCIAGQVLNLKINVDGSLTWSVSPTEPCVIDAFQLDILGDEQDEYHFTVNGTQADLSFLKTCEEWQFFVTAISNGVPGLENRLVDYVPLPANADLTLLYFIVAQITRYDVLLYWELSNHTHGECTLQYRVAITDTQSNQVQDVYFTGHLAHLSFLSPCATYHLAIRAVNTAAGGVEGPVLYRYTQIPHYPLEPPKLKHIEIGATSIRTTWELESYETNSCPVIYLYLDGGSYFNSTIRIADTFGRPPMQVNVTNLLPNSMYYFKTSVQNTGGLSTAASMAVQTLQLQSRTE
ncbi:hypothetical protein NQ315_001414 [Exocentrus adspersus]|uniref:Fibronectin type-III domain-containing protein n=1 Tax=Exocentrus adspersus TaxID=1586481 RepID=A0AAV8WFM8_9CUCU|nr:hypothetical protein NQ315_001414 [Exocentrus adspersus]